MTVRFAACVGAGQACCTVPPVCPSRCAAKSFWEIRVKSLSLHPIFAIGVP